MIETGFKSMIVNNPSDEAKLKELKQKLIKGVG
jgi:hypothetical protein